MTEQEARRTIKECGWSYLQRERGGHAYVYAARTRQYQRDEVYICPVAQLANLTVEQLKQKLAC